MVRPIGGAALLLRAIVSTVHRAMQAYETARVEHLQAEQHLRESEERARAIFDQAAVAMALESLDGTFLQVNDPMCALLGYTRDELLIRTWQDITAPEEMPHDSAAMTRLLTEPGFVYTTDKRYVHKDGHIVWGHLTLSVLSDAGGAPRHLLAVIEDISARVQAERALRYQARHDALTGLPNRFLLAERLEQALPATGQETGSCALLLLDLDRFKEVNDTFGHQHGDELLQQVARRLCSLLRHTDTAARLGGDEFAVLLPDAPYSGAVAVAEKIAAALDVPCTVAGQSLNIGASIGIALAPEHGQDVDTLLRHADVAMYLAKRDHRAYAVYDEGEDHYSAARLALLADLRAAIGRRELVLHYQPKIQLRDGAVCGVEALVRWMHPRRGLIPPDEFIGLAEQHGLMRELTQCVLDMAARQCRTWRQQGLVLEMAVNLSMSSLRDPDLPHTIASVLQREELSQQALRFELTESTLMADASHALDVLRQLQALGMYIAIDDFGTGYSSLAYLKRLPVDELKIDRSFVRDLIAHDADAAIVASTVGLAHALGLRVVAEGVEDAATQDALAELGCDAAQGYYFTRPLPAADLERWLYARMASQARRASA